MSMERVEELAQGRVYTGEQALEVGLVDELGDLEDAVYVRAKRAQRRAGCWASSRERKL
jgi:protease-4